MEAPRLIKGGCAIDDRGVVRYVNEFPLTDVKRFYTIGNHRQGLVRAWHAHKKEAKGLTALVGDIMIGVVQLDDFQNPSKELIPEIFILSDRNPAILQIPGGFAHGWMNLTADAMLGCFSTASLEESLADDFRFDARYWDIWKSEER